MTLPTASAQAAQVGVVSDISWGISHGDIDRTVGLMQEAGVRWTRVNVSWSGAEPNAKGQLNEGWLREIDYAVSKARGAGVEVLMPIADGVPYWASADPQKYRDGSGEHWNKYYRPSDAAKYADFTRRMVQRYSAQGVHAYEVWNEPNLSHFWPSGPNAAQYTELLRAAAPAIRQADPSATVVLGGLSKSDSTYMQQLYEAGAKPYFDVAAIHPYSGSVDPASCWKDPSTGRNSKDAFCGIEAVHDVMAANGDGDKKMWLTELGWSSATGAGTYGVGEAAQAAYLTAAMAKLETYPYVDKAFWYNFRNTYWLNDDTNQWEGSAGLLRTDFTPKPAYLALKAYATGGSSPSGGGSPPPGSSGGGSSGSASGSDSPGSNAPEGAGGGGAGTTAGDGATQGAAAAATTGAGAGSSPAGGTPSASPALDRKVSKRPAARTSCKKSTPRARTARRSARKPAKCARSARRAAARS